MLEPRSPPLPADETEVLAWARDSDTGAAVHVCHLPRDRSGRKCGCECPGCDAALDAVNAGKALSRDQILSHVWHSDYAGEGSIVETYISYLRRKLDHHDPTLIHTVRGFGYALRTETE